MKIFFNGFWDGFISNKDAVNSLFFIDLFKKVYNADIEITESVDDGDILCESIFSDYSFVDSKNFICKVLFSGESRLSKITPKEKYDIVLYGQRNNENIINCPLFVPYLYCQKFDLKNVNSYNDKYKKNKVLSVIQNPNGYDRNLFLDCLEKNNIEIDYIGSFRNNKKDDRVDKYKYWEKEYLDLISEYKFVITMENSIEDTYITEKIINSFVVNSIPIYIGSRRIDDYFNNKRFLNANNKSDWISIIEKIKELHKEDNFNDLISNNIFKDDENWRNIDDIARDIKQKLNKSVFLENITETRIICSKEYEPLRYNSMINLTEKLFLSDYNCKIYSKTYKNTITEDMWRKYVKRPMCDLLPWVGPYRYTKRGELSLFLNYYDHFIDIDKRYLKGIFLTLESDVVFLEEIYKSFNSFTEKLKTNVWDVISIGFGDSQEFDKDNHLEEFLPFQVIKRYNTRCTDSLLWNKESIEKILNYMKSEDFSEPFDHYLCRYFENNKDFNFYWTNPPYFKQMSAHGNDKSTIQCDQY